MSRNHEGAGQAETIGVEYLNGLYSYALVLTRNHAEGEDLVQETYFRAMQAMGSLREDRASASRDSGATTRMSRDYPVAGI